MRRNSFLFVIFSILVILATAPAFADWTIVTNPQTGLPEAVWTETSTVHYSRLNGSEWDPSTTLSTGASTDTSPILVFNSNGRRNAVWVTSGDQIIMRRLAPLPTSWSSETLVSDSAEVAAGPSGTAHSTDVFVGYEIVPGSANRQVAVSKIDPGSSVERTIVATASTDQPLEVQVHSDSGFLWLDWVNSESELGFSAWKDGVWDDPSYETYSDKDDISSGRKRIADLVKAP